jgi:hypothetical protein
MMQLPFPTTYLSPSADTFLSVVKGSPCQVISAESPVAHLVFAMVLLGGLDMAFTADSVGRAGGERVIEAKGLKMIDSVTWA